MNNSAPQRRRPLPYFSIIMALIVLVWGAKSFYDVNQQEEALLTSYINQETVSENYNGEISPTRMAELEQQAADAPEIAKKREEATWMLIAAGILAVIVAIFFVLTRALTRTAE